MRDILIEFLLNQLKGQQKLYQATAAFISGLTGEPPEQYLHADTQSGQAAQPSATRAPIFHKQDKYTSPDGMLRLTYSKEDPGAKRAYLALSGQTYQGGDEEYSQVTSAFQKVQIIEEDKMKYLTKRKDGRWQGSKVIDGKRVYVYAHTQKDCYEKLKSLGKQRKKPIKIMSVAEFANYFLETYKKGNVADRTYSDYKSTVKLHLSLKTPLNKVTTVQLQTLLNNLPATRIRSEVYQLLRQIFKKAYELDLIKKDVTQFLEKGKIAKAERRALNVDEQRKLVASLGDDTFARRVLFYLCTGARPSEFATVRKEELRPGWVKINGTKTKGATRWIKISDHMYDVLFNASSEFFKFALQKFRKRLQRKCSEVGIEYDVDIYTLRHTFATNLYILGVPEKDRQTYMGHASGSTMTNDVYTTFSPDTTAQDIYNIFGDWLPKF